MTKENILTYCALMDSSSSGCYLPLSLSCFDFDVDSMLFLFPPIYSQEVISV